MLKDCLPHSAGLTHGQPCLPYHTRPDDPCLSPCPHMHWHGEHASGATLAPGPRRARMAGAISTALQRSRHPQRVCRRHHLPLAAASVSLLRHVRRQPLCVPRVRGAWRRAPCPAGTWSGAVQGRSAGADPLRDLRHVRLHG